jgi:hypothetical protein
MKVKIRKRMKYVLSIDEGTHLSLPVMKENGYRSRVLHSVGNQWMQIQRNGWKSKISPY